MRNLGLYSGELARSLENNPAFSEIATEKDKFIIAELVQRRNDLAHQLVARGLVGLENLRSFCSQLRAYQSQFQRLSHELDFYNFIARHDSACFHLVVEYTDIINEVGDHNSQIKSSRRQNQNKSRTTVGKSFYAEVTALTALQLSPEENEIVPEMVFNLFFVGSERYLKDLSPSKLPDASLAKLRLQELQRSPQKMLSKFISDNYELLKDKYYKIYFRGLELKLEFEKLPQARKKQMNVLWLKFENFQPRIIDTLDSLDRIRDFKKLIVDTFIKPEASLRTPQTIGNIRRLGSDSPEIMPKSGMNARRVLFGNSAQADDIQSSRNNESANSSNNGILVH